MRVSYEAAVAASTGNPFAKWPRRGEGSRLEPVAQPSFKTPAKISRGGKVLTMGSCFARNIEEYFAASGYDVPVLSYACPADEQETSSPQGILNKYTLASITQEIEWLATVRADGGKVEWRHIEPMMYGDGEDQWFDLQLKTTKFVTRERALERRQQIYDIHVQFFDCDLAVLTPGLTESWFDTATGLYIQDMPTRKMAAAHPGRFQFEVMDIFTCHDMLQKAVRLLRENGTKQVVMTVSPVPLLRTMTSKDVLIANTYSKSTLRAVVGLICDQHDFIHYLPSFEKIMLSKEPSMWRDDLRHVGDAFVGEIVSTFARESNESLGGDVEDTLGINAAFEKGDYRAAHEQLLSLGDRAPDLDMVRFHEYAAMLHSMFGDHERALRHTRIVQEQRPFWKKGYKIEYYIATKIGDRKRADDAVERGVKNCDGVSAEEIRAVNKKMAAMLDGKVLQ